ncbi:hypothetical protein ACJJI4_23925 (plasmid) [Microbulbifer sp. TRSA002]|uniref:hypothetical protein n=1 Tax=Microbulbifer sp. TRSA002 TaxID=3243382 RepID=UPI004039F34F
MKKLAKMFLITGGGLIALLVGGMIISALSGHSPQQIRELNLIREWLWFRVIFYVLVILFWTYLSKKLAAYICSKNKELPEGSCEELALKINKRRFHVAAMFLFFELIIVQQLGAQSW